MVSQNIFRRTTMCACGGPPQGHMNIKMDYIEMSLRCDINESLLWENYLLLMERTEHVYQ